LASIKSQKGRLYLCATLPHRAGSTGRKQADITLKLDETAQNWRVAKKHLQLRERELDKRTFEWADWVDDHGKASWRTAFTCSTKRKSLTAAQARAPLTFGSWAICAS
jgi:hypothetical protein